MDYFLIIFLIFLSAIFSGLTLGFFSLSKSDLKRKAKLGDKEAERVYSLRKNGNLLLSTLLIGNVAVNSALAVFLGSITSGFAAGFLATALIVVFGEIMPQAIFPRYALAIGSNFYWLVKFFIFIFYPVTIPIATVLNKMLGAEIPTIYSKKELLKIIEEHEDSSVSNLDADEERIIKGALSFSNKSVNNIMTPRERISALEMGEIFNKETIQKIKKSGHSRIPIYENELDEIVGILYVKDLIENDIIDKTVGELARKKVIFVDNREPLDDLLNAFKVTKNHLFIVQDNHNTVVGIVTIEDVLEEILGVEIVDEFDGYGGFSYLSSKNNLLAKHKK